MAVLCVFSVSVVWVVRSGDFPGKHTLAATLTRTNVLLDNNTHSAVQYTTILKQCAWIFTRINIMVGIILSLIMNVNT